MNGHFLYDYALLRTPVLPMESILELNHILKCIDNNPSDEQSLKKLKNVFSNTHFLEAVNLASKDLFDTLNLWLEDKKLDAKKTERLIKSLHKYYSRMCTRGTPFGVFAGSAFSNITDELTTIPFAKRKLLKSYRFDMTFVLELIRQISELPDINNQIRFQVNNSLYKIGDKYIYTQHRQVNGARNYALVSLRETHYITNIISAAKNGATIEELSVFVRESGASEHAIFEFIGGLIRAQILISEFLPCVTDPDMVTKLISRLKKIDHISNITNQLELASNLFKNKDNSFDEILKIERLIEKLPFSERGKIIQADLFFSIPNTNLHRKTVSEIAEMSYRLQSICPNYISGNIDDFKIRFAKRYDEREIPLLQALDPDSGIGYALAISGNVENMPLLENLEISLSKSVSKSEKFHPLNELVNQKMKEFYKLPNSIICISDIEMQSILDKHQIEASKTISAYIMGSILCDSLESFDKGNYKFFPIQTHTPQLGKLFSRFAYGDEKLQEKLKKSIDDEQAANQDVILAEVVYLPEGHHANVVLRPKLRDFEIPYLCSSSVPLENQIDINDLLVSIKRGRVVLRSARLNKEIFPQITNSYSSMLGQPLYRFLAEIEIQNCKTNYYWPWGDFSTEPFLPRVEYNKFILSRARWRLKKVEFDGLSISEAENRVSYLRKKYTIPQYALLTHGGDNELFLDFENSYSIHHLIQHLKKNDVFLYEVLNMPENCFIKDNNGSYSNEVIFPIGTPAPFYKNSALKGHNKVNIEDSVTRQFPPGSEWLYFKIYGGNKILESILVDIIQPFCENAIKNKIIDKWFFIRFNDPDGHIRIRLHLRKDADELSWLRLPRELNEQISPFIENGQIASVMLDTYIREIERYGEFMITDSESLFFHDSVAVSAFLDTISGDDGENLRWKVGLYSINEFLNNFGYDLKSKYDLITRIRNDFFKEFSVDGAQSALKLERSLSNKYRKYNSIIWKLLVDTTNIDEMKDAVEIYQKRSNSNSAEIEIIKQKLNDRRNSKEILDALLHSHIHMCLNRLFISKQRMHELVVYHYLTKFYESLIAREHKMELSN